MANRRRTELDGLIGFFVNQLVLRTDLDGAPSGRALLAQVRDTCLRAYAHQDLPFERLVEELHPVRHLDRRRSFDVKLVLQNVPGAAAAWPGVTLTAVPLPSGRRTSICCSTLQETPTALQGELRLRDGPVRRRRRWRGC